MIQSRLTTRRGREFLEISVSLKAATVEEETTRAIDAAEAELSRWGLSSGTIIRSRLWTADRETRDRASLARKDALSGLKRGASASFIAPARIGSGHRVALDIIGMRPRPGREAKTVREYDPPIVPPAFVELDGLIALSGLTDTSADLDRQLGRIRERIDETLALVRAEWSHVISVAVYAHRSVGTARIREDARNHLPPAMNYALAFCEVDGFSHPAKLVEIEVTAELGET